MAALRCLGDRLLRAAAAWYGLKRLMVVFAILNLLDLTLTWVLLHLPGGGVCEANPVASSVLTRAGWPGLCLYKLTLAAVVVVLCMVIARHRPRTGRYLCAFGCKGLAVVVAYSLLLLLARPGDAEARRSWQHAQERAQSLDTEVRQFQCYTQQLNDLAHDLAADRRTLRQATQDLLGFLDAVGYDPRPQLSTRFGPLEFEAILAARLVREVGFVMQEEGEAPGQALGRLTQTFRQEFHHPLPQFATESFRPRHVAVVPQGRGSRSGS